MEADRVTRGPKPSLDSLYAALADSRRRHVLSVTRDRPGPRGIDALARSIVRVEGNGGSNEPPSESERSIVCELHHVHVPKLSAAGLLAYDGGNRTVARTPLPARFESIVGRAVETQREVNGE